MLKPIVMSVVFAALTTQADAQSIFDNCRTLISEGLREYQIETSSSSYLNSVHDRYCEQTGQMKSSSAGLGLDLVVKAVPVSFTGNYGSIEEGMRNFCKNYASLSQGASEENQYSETVVLRAYDSFDACTALASVGVITRHKVETVNRVNFFLAPGFSRPVRIVGINPSDNVECSGLDPRRGMNATASAGEASAEITFTPAMDATIANNATFNMVCTRTGIADQAGNMVYEEGVVTVLTDVSPMGNYTIYMPRATVLKQDNATALLARIDELKAHLDTLSGEVSNGIPRELARSKDGEEGTIHLYGRFITQEMSYDCPSGQYVAGVTLNVLQPHHVVSGGDREGKIRTFNWMKVRCRSIRMAVDR